MSAWPWQVDALVAILLIVGAVFALIGSLGLLRLEGFMRRLHAPTKATTLGVGSILLAVCVAKAGGQGVLSLREALLAVFAFWSAPLAAHQLARAWLARQRPH